MGHVVTCCFNVAFFFKNLTQSTLPEGVGAALLITV